jgi:hypothetical protein
MQFQLESPDLGRVDIIYHDKLTAGRESHCFVHRRLINIATVAKLAMCTHVIY